MLHLFLTSEADPEDRADDPRYARYVARVRAAYERGRPEAARMPGIVWPLTVFQRRGAGLRELLDAAVANCRAHGGDWELGVALMLRTHMVVDSAGGLRGVDEDLAELRELSLRVGDRWMRAQVCSAAGEAAMARGRLAEAREEYGEALRLAHEVGAYTEAPFLIARLGEIAYRSGDRRAAEAALDEASEAADRHRVTDARAFVSLLRAFMALDERDTVRARELCGTTRAEIPAAARRRSSSRHWICWRRWSRPPRRARSRLCRCWPARCAGRWGSTARRRSRRDWWTRRPICWAGSATSRARPGCSRPVSGCAAALRARCRSGRSPTGPRPRPGPPWARSATRRSAPAAPP
ncbi:hypothetical protein SGLAM104S_00468 [Streptomyces glaucescens]